VTSLPFSDDVFPGARAGQPVPTSHEIAAIANHKQSNQFPKDKISPALHFPLAQKAVSIGYVTIRKKRLSQLMS